MESNFGMSFFLYTCSIFSETLFVRGVFRRVPSVNCIQFKPPKKWTLISHTHTHLIEVYFYFHNILFLTFLKFFAFLTPNLFSLFSSDKLKCERGKLDSGNYMSTLLDAKQTAEKKDHLKRPKNTITTFL